MNARHPPESAHGPDLLARYLNAYLQARQLSDAERPWGLGNDELDGLWIRLTAAMNGDAERLNKIVANELSDLDRGRIIETLAPLIFALPLRSYPAELRAERSGPQLVLRMRHPDASGSGAKHKAVAAGKKPKDEEKELVENVGFLPAALTLAFATYLRRVLKFDFEQQRREITVSCGGRRRRVRVTILARERGIVIRFLERMKSPADE